jgi:hypothetical protein
MGEEDRGAAPKLVYRCETVAAAGGRTTRPATATMGNKSRSMFEFRLSSQGGRVPQHETGGLVDNCFDGLAAYPS